MSSTPKYPKCCLGSVVSPGEYWLVSKLKTHVQEVRKLEELLSDEMNDVLTTPDPASLDANTCVAVENQLTKGCWQRGKIINKLETDVYKVFLIDYGNFAEINLRHLQIITNQKFTQIEPLAFRLCLDGIVPCTPACGSVRKKVSKEWSQSAKDYVNNLFSKKVAIYVKQNQILERTVFGDLYLVDKPDGQLLSLGKLLCVEEYAVYSASYYREKVMHMGSSVQDESGSEKDLDTSSELSMKLERVRQWQLSCQDQAMVSDRENNAKSVSSGASRTESGSDVAEDSKTSPYKWQNTSKSDESLIVSPKPKYNLSPDGKRLKANRFGRMVFHNKSVHSKGVNREKDTSPDTRMMTDKLNTKEEMKEFHLALDENLKVTPTTGKKDSNFGIFTLFNDSIVEPVNTFRDLNVSENIILNLEAEGNFTNLSTVQRWAIPSIQRGHNVVILSGAKTGKTLSYIIPVIEILEDKVNAKEVLVGNGPMAIILCSGSRSCEFIHHACLLLLGNYSKKQGSMSSILRVEIAHGGGCEKESWIRLTNGCEILVTTPHCLVRLLKHRGLTNLERLNILVLDEVDIITQEPFLSQVKIILYKAKVFKDTQRIFCGEKWTQELANICHVFAKNHALIASYLEVAVYAKLKPDVLFVDRQMKPQAVLDVLGSKIGTHRILIACEKTEEVLYLFDVFKTKGHVPLIAHSNMVVHDIRALEKSWKSDKVPGIIICTDDVICDLGIKDAQVLIHYSLPDNSKTNFGLRFSTIMKSCENRNSLEDSKSLKIAILIDDENHYQLPHVVEFILRLGGKLPEGVRNMSDEILWRIEINKRDVRLCPNLLKFGECKSIKKCPNRHALIKEVDSCQTPLTGLVKFKVTHVHDVSRLSIRLTEAINADNENSHFKDMSWEISEELRKFYGVEENRKFLGTPKLMDLCAVQLTDSGSNEFHRAKVVKYKKFNMLNQPIQVFVKLIDSGRTILVPVCVLYELPEELKKYPEVLDGYLCNLLPNDFDTKWSETAVSHAKKLFLRELSVDEFWLGKIVLALDSSLHLDPVKLCHKLPDLNTSAINFCARKKLLSDGIAVPNNKHLENLYALCEKGQIDVSRYQNKEKVAQNSEPQWSFLESNFMKVQFVAAENTSSLFVRVAKFKDLLKGLEKECQEEGEKVINAYKRDGLMKYGGNWSFQTGMYCLALYENSWNRARIESKENNKLVVFFIDYGDFHCVEEIVPIPDKLLLQLPAQAIDCSLTGVNHESTCSTKVLDEIYMFSEEGKNDLYVSVIGEKRRSDITGGYKYEVNLLNLNGVSLNKKLVDSGLLVASGTNSEALEDIDIIPEEANGKKEVEEEEEADEVEGSTCVNGSVPEREPTGLVGGLNDDDPSYFLHMPPDVYEDENAQNFLEEFMMQVFPQAYVKSKTEVEEVPKEIEEKPTEEETVPQNNDVEVKKSSRQYLKNFLNKSFGKKSSTPEVVTYTPQVLWSQNHSHVQLKVMLNNVTSYKFDCSLSHIIFRCSSEGKLYVINLKLFGSINPQLSQVQPKTFYVLISLKKLCSLQWPRLHSDKRKYRWIKFDVEDYAVPQNTYLEGLCRRAMERIKSGQITEEKKFDEEIKFVSSSSSSGDSLSDSEDGSDSMA